MGDCAEWQEPPCRGSNQVFGADCGGPGDLHFLCAAAPAVACSPARGGMPLEETFMDARVGSPGNQQQQSTRTSRKRIRCKTR